MAANRGCDQGETKVKITVSRIKQVLISPSCYPPKFVKNRSTTSFIGTVIKNEWNRILYEAQHRNVFRAKCGDL